MWTWESQQPLFQWIMSLVIANNNILNRKLQYLTLPIYTDIFIWNNSAGNLGNATTLKVNEAVRHDKSWHSANLYIPQEDNEAEGKAKCLWCTRGIYLWEWMPIYSSFFLILKKGFQLSICIIYSQVKGWRKIWASILLGLRAQFWNDTTMGYRNNRTLGKRTTYHSAEMLQLVENLLQINDELHWFSFLLKHGKVSWYLTAKINCRGIHWRREMMP